MDDFDDLSKIFDQTPELVDVTKPKVSIPVAKPQLDFSNSIDLSEWSTETKVEESTVSPTEIVDESIETETTDAITVNESELEVVEATTDDEINEVLEDAAAELEITNDETDVSVSEQEIQQTEENNVPVELNIPEQLFSTDLPSLVNTDNPLDRHVINKTLGYFLNKALRSNKVFDSLKMRAAKAKNSTTAVIWEEGCSGVDFGAVMITSDSNLNPKPPLFTKMTTDDMGNAKAIALIPVAVDDFILMGGLLDDSEYSALYCVTDATEITIHGKNNYELILNMVAEKIGTQWNLVNDRYDDDFLVQLENSNFAKTAYTTINSGNPVYLPIFITRYVDKHVDVNDYQSCIASINEFANPPALYNSLSELYKENEIKVGELFKTPMSNDEMISILTVLNYEPKFDAIVVNLVTIIYDHGKRTSVGKRMFIDRTILRENDIYIPLKFWNIDNNKSVSFDALKAKLSRDGANIANVKRTC